MILFVFVLSAPNTMAKRKAKLIKLMSNQRTQRPTVSLTINKKTIMENLPNFKVEAK